ncbi:glycosyltransferase family 2 protein [Rufibacter aurantiacus]|uniref:glycosyltransferase family 2 protein n=1 Tax=Rufibacter aurantiacus TaxID=2817374 RepID=UPI001B306047|nr:glycosyltransferase family A protein [Rufibacter aurantiacus]
MKNNPLVSIIIPNYNRASIINETLDSLIAQTYNNWEAIIVDDGSTDDSIDIIQKYVCKDERFILVKRDRLPKGAQTCRNIGLNLSKGEYAIFLDSDDLLASHCIESRVEKMLVDLELEFAVFPMQVFINSIGDSSQVWMYESFEDNYLSGFLFRPQWPITSPIWKTESIKKINGFDESLSKWQDWDIHVRALIEGFKFKVYPNSVDCYCRRGNERMSSGQTRLYMYSNRIPLLGNTVSNLKKKNLLNDLNKRLMAANYLLLACKIKSIGEDSLAFTVWKQTLEYGLVNKMTYSFGKKYINIRSRKIVENTYLKRVARKLFSLLMPKYVVWFH